MSSANPWIQGPGQNRSFQHIHATHDPGRSVINLDYVDKRLRIGPLEGTGLGPELLSNHPIANDHPNGQIDQLLLQARTAVPALKYIASVRRL